MTLRALALANGIIYAAYQFNSPAPNDYVVQWNGTAWSRVGTGSFDGFVNALAVDSNGLLYAGGSFTQAGGVAAANIASWNGSTWSALSTGTNAQVIALATSGTDLYAGGTFGQAGAVFASGVAKWDGTAWSRLGFGVIGRVRALAATGTTVYVGGDLTSVSGSSTAASRIGKWDGSSWSNLGGGVSTSGGGYSIVYSLALAADGSLYVGGEFNLAGSTAANNLARWNGSAWSALGAGSSTPGVLTLATAGSDLYASGTYALAGGGTSAGLAQWNGSAWNALGSGLNSGVSALLTAPGNLVYAGGNFTAVGDNSKATVYFGRYSNAPAPTISGPGQ